MMEEENKQYLKGYNTGYRMQQFDPELFALLKPNLSETNEYHKAILQGALEFERTKGRSRNADIEKVSRKPPEQDIER